MDLVVLVELEVGPLAGGVAHLEVNDARPGGALEDARDSINGIRSVLAEPHAQDETLGEFLPRLLDGHEPAQHHDRLVAAALPVDGRFEEKNPVVDEALLVAREVAWPHHALSLAGKVLDLAAHEAIALLGR